MTKCIDFYSQLDEVQHFCCTWGRCLTLRSWTLFSTPLRGISTLTGKFAKVLNLISHRRPLTLIYILITAFILLCPSLSWALQTHDAPEGFFVHQMAHILFMASLVYLAWDIQRNAFSGHGWRYLLLFCLFMFFWNVLAFSGHAISVHLSKSDFFTESTYLYTRINGPFCSAKLTYYIAKLDHLISVPALLFLFLALRTFYHSIETDDINGEDE